MKDTFITDDLIVRFLAGNADEEEQRLLLAWIHESPDNEKRLFILKDIYDGAAGKRLFEEANTQEGWEQLQARLTPRRTLTPAKSGRWTAQLRRYAAVWLIGVLGTAACLYFFYRGGNPQKTAVSTCHITTEKGDRATVMLPDGSIVRLNACSSLAYQSDYGENAREVIFSGEAYFDIQTNPDIPFTVKTFGLNIKAYGTTFNVKAYPEEDMIETTLVKGMVVIENEENKQIVTLAPNQVVAIPKLIASSHPNNNQRAITPDAQLPVKTKKADLPTNTTGREAVLRKNVKTEEYTSWKDDKWIISSESLETLAKKIERRYDVSILIEDEASKKYVFSGTLRNYPLEQVLEVIRLNAPIQYAIKEKTVVIKEEKQLKKQYQKLIYSP